MRQKLLVGLCAVIIGQGSVLAGTTESSTAAVEKMGAIRARVSTKMDALWRLINSNVNGVTTVGNTLQTQYSQTVATLQKRLQQEIAKPVDARDQALIDSANAKLSKAYAMWNAYNNKDLPVFTQKLADIQNVTQGLYQVVATAVSQDQNWLRAELDPELLTSTLATLDKKIDEITAAATPLIASYIKLCNERAASLED